MSVADMLAAARAGGAGVEKPATPAAASPTEPAAEVEAAEPAPVTAPASAANSESGEIKPVDKSKMTIDQMVAYCREHDLK
jgi:hypothetical protein